MKNLKKVLALALVFAMTFALTVSAAEFTDAADIGVEYIDDVNMLVELGVIGGYPDGSVQPKGNITRAEFAKMAYTLKYGSDTDGDLFAAQKSQFTDVEGVSSIAWAKGYINFCANQKIVSGKGNNKYDPQGNITVAEATKMILVIMGCDAEKEGLVGASWLSNTVALGMSLGVYDGWAGDPTQLATRELVAKLMRNAIFAPVYEYSAITGTGSQKSALGILNETLGEKTMGLKTVTGIVVANERYVIDTDEKGEALDPVNAAAAATGVGSEESIVYYEYKTNDGDVLNANLTIDRALSDDMLGCKVNVFFKADTASSAEYSYKNVEVIGDVLLHSDTVAYDVAANDVAIMPDGKSSSKTEILPYIAFTVDGKEVQIKADARTTAKIAKNLDVMVAGDQGACFVPYAYVSTATLADNGALAHATAGDSFFTTMGKGAIAKYRFISVDGGKNYSYMFKMIDDANAAKYANVTSYSEAKGTISLPSVGTIDLEEAVLPEGIAKDDAVVYYRKDGKIVVEKAATMTGAVDAFNEDGSVVINGADYFAEENLFTGFAGAIDELSEYYTDNRAALSADTTYYVYGNVLLDVEEGTTVANVENYAVILNSFYDADLDTAYVKLGFADNTEGTYKVGKFHTPVSSKPNDAANDRAQDYADNARFGMVVKYAIRTDGSVDLSGQDIKTIEAGTGNASEAYQAVALGDVAISEKAFVDGNGRKHYGASSSAVAFILYGKVDVAQTEATYAPIKSRAYKLDEVKDASSAPIPGLQINKAAVTDSLSSAIINTNSGNNTVVAFSMTHGDKLDNIKYHSSDAVAYIVSAKQNFNTATGAAYANIKMITVDGLVSARTIDDVTTLTNTSVFSEAAGYVGDIAGYEPGTIVKYAINADGVITTIDNDGVPAASIGGTLDTTNEGFYKITIVAATSDRITFYNSDDDVPLDGSKLDTSYSDAVLFSEDGVEIITIDDNDFVEGAFIATASRGEALTAGHFNAIAQVDADGYVCRIFSFID